MKKKDWPHQVTARVHQMKFLEMTTWLHSVGHVLHETVKFGKQFRHPGNEMVDQQVGFKDANKAMHFKLAWG